ncbi:MAG: RNA methyltransferase [Acidimicrobiales bacterium]|nr:MAG: RNA methyltransferase [Acidimicrobiales bacterium]
MAVVEGPRAIQTALDIGAELEELFYRSDQSRIADTFREKGVLAHEVESDVLDHIADSGSPQGLLAVAKVDDSALPSIAKCRRIVVVDSVQDPGNVGAIVRTAVAAGFEAIVTSSGTADLLSPRSIRASAGTIFGLQSARNMDLGSVLDSLLAEGHFVVATNSQGEQDFRSLEVTDQMTLVLGSEAHGVSDSTLERASALVTIPMGLHVESLNVAVAAGLVMYRMQTIENDH